MLGCDAVRWPTHEDFRPLAGLAAETGRIVNTYQIDIAIRSDQMRFCYGFHLLAQKQESATAQASLSDLQALPEALVHQNFDIYVTVEFAAVGVIVADSRMGGSIADGHENAPHRNVLHFPEVLCDDCSPFFAQLLIRFFA